MMSTSFSESLVLDDSEKGVVIKGTTDEAIAAKRGLKAGDEIVAATIHLDHLSKNEVMNILKVLEPYDNNMKVLTKKDLSASAGLGSLALKNPAEMLNIKKELSLDASAEAPVLSLDGQSGKLNAAHGLKGDKNGPTLNGDLPSLIFNTPSADAGTKFKMPSLGLTGQDLQGDVDGTFKTPDVSVSTPQLKPPSASVNVNKPVIKTGNYKTPKFTMPTFNLPYIKTPQTKMDLFGDTHLSVNGNPDMPDLNLSSPKLDLKSPDLDLNGPKVDLKGTDVNLEIPNADLKWKGVKRPEADLNADLSPPDVNLSTPKLDGGIGTGNVDINLPKAEINGPQLNAQAPHIDTDAPSGKINWPKWKMPHFHGRKPNMDLDGNLNAPDVDLSVPTVKGGINAHDFDYNLPNADLEGPDLNIKTPNIDAEAPSGKINWPKWKMPHFHGRKPNMDLDGNLNAPDVDLSVPTVKGGINAHDFDYNLPNADLEGPDLNIKTPNIDAEAPSGKINWPHLKWKKPKLQGPKADFDLDSPDLNLSSPKIQGDFNAPNAELNLPKAGLKGPDVDVQAPKVDIDAPSGKNWPHLKWKKPKLHGPKADAGLNADLSTPDLDLSVPQFESDTPDAGLTLSKANVDIKAPDADIQAPSGKFKFPTLKKPKLQRSGPKLKGPDVDLDVDADMKAPDLSLEPQLNGLDVDLDLPKANLDVKAPNADIEAPSGKIKWPTFKKPKWSVQDPKINGSNVDVDVPDLNLSAPKADAEINVPDVKLNSPKADVDIDAPDVEGLSGKFKWFKKITPGTLKGPKADIDADVKVPDVDLKKPELDLSAPDINLSAPNIKGDPKVNLSAPNLDPPDGKVKFPIFTLPKLKEPKVKGPEIDADFNAPNIDSSLDALKLDVDVPNANIKEIEHSLSAPKIEGGLHSTYLNLSAPKADLKVPDVDLKKPVVDTDAPSEKFKIPSLNMPSFHFGGLKAKEPDPVITAPDVSVPGAHLKLPQGPNLDLPKGDFQVPDLSFSPEFDGKFSAPNIDTKLPKAELEAPDATLKTLNVGVNLPKVDLKGQTINTPDLASDYNISGPALDTRAPKIEHNIKEPKIEAPDVDVNLEKSKWPHFKIPLFSGSKIKGPDVDTSTDLGISPDVKVEVPTVVGNTSSPDVNVSVPKERMKLNTRSNETDDEMAFPLFKLHRLPRQSFDATEHFDVSNLTQTSKHDTEEKDYVISKGIRLPKVNARPAVTDKVNILERLKMAKEKTPSANASPVDARSNIDLKLGVPTFDARASAGASSLVREGTFIVEKPESALAHMAPNISDENDKLSLSLSNMLGLNIKNSDTD